MQCTCVEESAFAMFKHTLLRRVWFILMTEKCFCRKYNFLLPFFPPQEIDAITTQPSTDDAASHSSVPTTAPPRPEVNAQQPAASEEQNQQSTEFEYNTEYSLAGGNCLYLRSSVHVLMSPPD